MKALKRLEALGKYFQLILQNVLNLFLKNFRTKTTWKQHQKLLPKFEKISKKLKNHVILILKVFQKSFESMQKN